jgi:hypothetical protein
MVILHGIDLKQIDQPGFREKNKNPNDWINLTENWSYQSALNPIAHINSMPSCTGDGILFFMRDEIIVYHSPAMKT